MDIANVKTPELSEPSGEHLDFSSTMRFASSRSAILKRRNLNKTSDNDNPTFSRYSKDDISDALEDPSKNEDTLRDASVYMYNASSHYRRIIQYFTSLTDLAYIIVPTGINTSSYKETEKLRENYFKTISLVDRMDIRSQFKDIVSTCLREDTFYGTIWNTKEAFSIQQLPPRYCSITTVENNVPNVTFNFSYFSRKPALLKYYPDEFTRKFEEYRDGKADKWQELDAPNSFAIKCTSDILDYAIPPFAGLFREIYDIEDYKQLKKAKTELDNYALLAMYLEKDAKNNWKLSFTDAKEYWSNLDSVLPEQIGSILSPMKVEKIDFERSGSTDGDKIAEAENHLWSAAGVSSLIFNNTKATADALLVSIKADQAITYSIVKLIGSAINRFLSSANGIKYARNFKIVFLDVSAYNRKDFATMCKDAMTLGAPTISMYLATIGLDQPQMDSMSFLEQEVLDLPSKFRPLESSYTKSSSENSDNAGSSNNQTDEGNEE